MDAHAGLLKPGLEAFEASDCRDPPSRQQGRMIWSMSSMAPPSNMPGARGGTVPFLLGSCFTSIGLPGLSPWASGLEAESPGMSTHPMECQGFGFNLAAVAPDTQTPQVQETTEKAEAFKEDSSL